MKDEEQAEQQSIVDNLVLVQTAFSMQSKHAEIFVLSFRNENENSETEQMK